LLYARFVSNAEFLKPYLVALVMIDIPRCR